MHRTWAEAMSAGLHGPGGFYRRGRGPGTDFRTSATLAPDLLADALLVLFEQLPAAVATEVVEVGAGDGRLLTALADRLPRAVCLTGVEQRQRPSELPDRISWRADLPNRVTGLLLAFEWLDTVPVDVVVDGRLVEVDPAGQERAGPPPEHEDLVWLDRWWPGGSRREVGRRRDDAWADAVSRVDAGLAVAVDYGHLIDLRPSAGTLTAYRDGQQVSPVPDSNTDVTAAVAWDAVLEAVLARGGRSLLPQATVLGALGVTSALPSRAGTTADSLRRAARARLLLDPAGLGGFQWAISAVGIEPPGLLEFLE